MQGKSGRHWRAFHESVSGIMRCPSSGLIPEVPYNDDDDSSSGMALAHLSKGNYVACFGGNTMLNAVPADSQEPVNPDPGYAGIFSMVTIRKWPVGVRLGQGTRVAKVSDGMSKTVMLSEMLTWSEPNERGAPVDETVGHGNDDWRGVWMIPSVGASAFTGRFPPNSTGQQADFRGQVAKSWDVIPACGTGLTTTDPEIPCEEDRETSNIWASARSRHSEGVNAAMGDGSVRYVEDDIDAVVWHSMCTRSGAEVVNEE
jgi:prepilin-type processing-associated H-X9-DG protein